MVDVCEFYIQKKLAGGTYMHVHARVSTVILGRLLDPLGSEWLFTSIHVQHGWSASLNGIFL